MALRLFNISTIITLSFLLFFLKAQAQNGNQHRPYTEQYRPQFHFSPKSKWLNDPNGMVYYKGVYHLFYQHYPDTTVWGPMHWGHATSTDLVHWKHQPIALFPDQEGMIFSGSVVVDHENLSGLGTEDSPALLAFYTTHNIDELKKGSIDYENQAMAFSLDDGLSWTKYNDNKPIIKNPGIKDFRDPKVSWHAPTNRWIMALAVNDHIEFWSASNGIDWVKESDFGADKGQHGRVWECPDLIKMRVDGTSQEKYVLLVSLGAAPFGGSGTQYFVGDFDGHQFIVDPNFNMPAWLDYGRDNYAGVTWSNTPEEEHLLIGWMNNWDYAKKIPTSSWRGAMTVPRKLSLHAVGENYHLKNVPIKPLEALRTELPTLKKLNLTAQKNTAVLQENIDGGAFEVALTLRQINADSVSLVFYNGQEESYIINYANINGLLSADRSQSGNTVFDPKFLGARTQAKLIGQKEIKLQVLIDWSSVELFANDGEVSITNQVFPSSPFSNIKVISHGGDCTVSDISIYRLSSIWGAGYQ